MSRTIVNNKVAATLAGIGLAIAVVWSGVATPNYQPVGGNGGSPTPIWETPTPSVTVTVTQVPSETPVTVETVTPLPEETAIPVVELPNTGAGSTANETLQNNHTGWHTDTWCDSGWRVYHRWYAIANPWGGHSYPTAHQFGNYGRCYYY